MDDLLEAINEYYHNNGQYPQVKVSRMFALENHLMMSELIEMIKIDDSVDDWELSPPS